MIDHYQPFLLPFLQFRKNRLTIGIKRYYYYSFEDGLWDLLKNKHIPKGATVLIPNFYCMDVVANIRSHGWTVEYYPLDTNFQISSLTFQTYIKKYNPSVVIVFHAVGITSNLILNRTWTKILDKKTIIIEDNVHRLVNTETVTVPQHNWFILDSLRKVSPLYGSYLYGKNSDMSFIQTNFKFNVVYVFSSLLLFLFFRITLLLGHSFHSSFLIWFAHKKILSAHDEIIGDSIIPYRGLPFFSYIHSYFNCNKIAKLKMLQVALYEFLLWRRPLKNFHRIKIPVTDFPFLHAYPISMNKTISASVHTTLHKRHVSVWEKFPDSPWSKSRSVTLLPLGFHINTYNIRNICSVLCSLKT